MIHSIDGRFKTEIIYPNGKTMTIFTKEEILKMCENERFIMMYNGVVVNPISFDFSTRHIVNGKGVKVVTPDITLEYNKKYNHNKN